MGRELKNIIVLKNIYPSIFDEVIFVLNQDNKSKESKNPNLVYEARKIIDDYVNGNQLSSYDSIEKNIYCHESSKKANINTILNIALFLSVTLFVLILMKVF